MRILIVNNQRPGVYSSYTLTSSYGAPRSAKAAVVVAEGAASLSGMALSFTGYQSAADALGTAEENARLLECVRILFSGGVSHVYVSAVSGKNYTEALSLIQNEDSIGAIVCDAPDESALDALKTSVQKSCSDMRERIAFIGRGVPTEAITDAKYLNSERIVMCCPAVSTDVSGDADSLFAAAAMAAMVLSENDPAYNWNGAELETLSDCAKLMEDDIQGLIAAGVTVLENRGSAVRCVRPVTTKTSVNSVPDYSLRPLNAILIIDDVISSVRESLRVRLAGARLTPAGIASQIIVELTVKKDEGLIEAFDQPVVRASEDDPSVCVAELAFKIAHVLSQIHISAYIRL